MAAVAIVRRLNIHPAAHADDPRAGPGPILNALPPLLWVRTAESQPSACLSPCIGSGPGSPSLRTGPTFASMFSLSADQIGSAETPCCLPPLYFTLAPHFGRSTASTPTTHWPRPKVFITDTRSGNSPPSQRHGNSITQPNDPSKHHDDKSWRARELSRRTNQVLYMATRCRG